MIIDKIKSTKSIPEMVTLFITINFIVQISYKFGFYSNYGYWALSLFSPIEIMLGNIELIFLYIMVFTGIIYEKAVAGILITILSLSIYPYLSTWLYTQDFTLPTTSFFIIAIGVLGYFLKIVKENTTYEIYLLVLLLCIAPLFYGLNSGSNLQRENLALIELNKPNTDKWYILEKFSDSFLLININDKSLKILKIEDANKIQKKEDS